LSKPFPLGMIMKDGKNKIPTEFENNRVVEVCTLLNQENCAYLIAGGIALNLHGILRATKDIDLLIPRNQKNTEKILKALSSLMLGIAKELDAAKVTEKPFTIIGDIPRVDLLTIANKIKFEDAIQNAKILKIGKIKIPYLSRKDLIKSKQTDRLQDQADLERLKAIRKK